MPKSRNILIKDSKKISLIVDPKNLEVIEFSKAAEKFFNASKNKVKKIFLNDLIFINKINVDFKKLLKLNDKKYDIILMDINLGKGMSGTEATKEIRKIESYKDTPIVAITGFAMRGGKDEFIKSGCTHYLSKPFSRARLLTRIKLNYFI